MNDIERLIAGLSRPSPSEELDARIAEIANQPQLPKRKRSLNRRILALAATAPCTGYVGFMLGRQSATNNYEPLMVSARPALETSISKGIPQLARVNAADREALTRFVAPKPFVSLFGGAVEYRQASSPSE